MQGFLRCEKETFRAEKSFLGHGELPTLIQMRIDRVNLIESD
jgi:hypothetical protein